MYKPLHKEESMQKSGSSRRPLISANPLPFIPVNEICVPRRPRVMPLPFSATDSSAVKRSKPSPLPFYTVCSDAPIQRMPEESEPQKSTFSVLNNTGIPTQMKREFEEKSGLSFDDVRVHYNSEKPAQLQALAYTQGNQVYVGQGQEKHLRHELGHVVQQKQGFVKETTKIEGIPVNNDMSLEKQADNFAVQRSHSSTLSLSSRPLITVQYELSPNLHKKTVVQRLISQTPFYPLSPGSLLVVQALDNVIPQAELAATNAVTVGAGPYTPHQRIFMLNPNAANWGYCVEEQLNLLAPAIWNRQFRLNGARPDYHALVNVRHVFVDLTTQLQSANVGAHVSGKLINAGVPHNNVEAADIVYTAPVPGNLANVQLPPHITAGQSIAFYKYQVYLQGNADYFECVEWMQAQLPAHPTFNDFCGLNYYHRHKFAQLVNNCTNW